MLPPPAIRALRVHAGLPAHFAQSRPSDWSSANFGGRKFGSFLEGPAFDAAGNLYVVDIPFGRIFCLDAAGDWRVICEYDGLPNGLKVESDGKLLVADHKHGLLRIDPATGVRRVLLDSLDGEPLLGLNDLTIAPDGTIYVTDQGQTGLHDPRGRVLRLTREGAVEIILANGPSPNGLVFDADRAWLYVAMTRANAIWRVPLVQGRPSKVGLAIQLSGGIGPDGLAFDERGNLLVVHPPIGIWQFDRHNLPSALFRTEDDSYVTNLALRRIAGRMHLFATDSLNGRIVTATLDDVDA